MTDKLTYITNNDTQNYSFCKLQLVVKTFNTQLNEPNQAKFNKSPKKLLSQIIRKCYYETLGTSVINIRVCPPSQG